MENRTPAHYHLSNNCWFNQSLDSKSNMQKLYSVQLSNP